MEAETTAATTMEEEKEEENNAEEEEEEEERCELEFEEGTDPIDLVHGANNGVDLFRQFERLEYEALAERKRRALQDQFPDRGEPSKKPRQDEFLGATMEEIDEMMNFGIRKRRKRGELRKKGRKKGSRKKLSPEVSRKIGDATLYYASGEYKEAIPVLHEVIRLAPNLPDGYYLLGLIHDSLKDRRKAFNFHMIAAFFTPKDASLWRKLVAWSIELRDPALVKHCLSKAIVADPEDVGLKFDLALLYFEAGEVLKAAEVYEQILGVGKESVEARKMASKMYNKCGKSEKAIQILEDYVNTNPKADMSVTSLLISLYMSNNMHDKALGLINVLESEMKSLPFGLKAKSVICHALLGDMKHAEVLLQNVPREHSGEVEEAVAEVANSLFEMGKYDYALKFYFTLEQVVGNPDGDLYKKIAECYIALEERNNAIAFFYRALKKMEENVEIRMTLASLLLEEGNKDEAIILLSPPQNSASDKIEENVKGKEDESIHLQSPTPNSEAISNSTPPNIKPWWQNAQIKIQLAKIYRDKGLLEDFANTIFSSVRETLIIESINQKLKPVKKLSKNILKERAKLLDEQQPDSVFHGFRPLAERNDLVKAFRAKRSLEKIAALKEEKKSAAIAAGLDWQSNDSLDEELPRREKKEPPFPGLLQEAENHILIVDLCKALASLQRYWDSLEIINKTLKVANDDVMSHERKEDLRSLGAQIAYGTADLKHGFDYVRYIVQQHPYSNAAWNCYYNVVSRLEDRYTKHNKFIRYIRNTKNDCVPPIIISGHQFNYISQHQAASADYLEAFKLQPDSPLINLCVGTSLINLALGFRLQEKHQCILLAFAFLYNYLRLSDNSQEALYNIARAYHHVGPVTLAVSYYEKVLAMKQKDEPVPRLPYEEKSPAQQNGNYDYCDLRREAAYHLHLIYKKSGAVDLARQILKNYCTA
ncbi:hypothetical protein LUZ60_007653 [Juncus effusus]|nr:hypothetical protein LUZ60_007653 [Juncus effusus]